MSAFLIQAQITNGTQTEELTKALFKINFQKDEAKMDNNDYRVHKCCNAKSLSTVYHYEYKYKK